MALTYEPIATTTLGGAAASITFSSIPGTYTDIKLIANLIGTAAVAVFIRPNGNAGTVYSQTYMFGNGSSASSSFANGNNTWYHSYSVNLFTTNPQFLEMDILSYANSQYKTALLSVAADNNGSGGSSKEIGLWRSTSSITSLVLSTSSSTFAAGTTATLYGIKAA